MRIPNRPRSSPNSVADSGFQDQPRPRRPSVLGRPRALTLAQIAQVLAWHDSHVTLKQLAADLGVSTSTVVHIIKTRGGDYKQAPPEEREATLAAHRAHCRALTEAHWM
jgi:hypothetical protein